MAEARSIVLCRDCLDLSSGDYQVSPACGSTRIVAHPELDRLDIAHIDCDAFYASVEKRDDPSLRDKPLIVGHAGGRGVVTTACYIARKFGPRSAMPMFKAMEMCPHAVVIQPNMAKYKAVSNEIRAIFRDATPIIQPVSLDEAYMDLSDDARGELIAGGEGPPAMALAEVARRIEREVGITVSIGLSYNKFLAKLASDLEKPRGYSVIGEVEAKTFLAPLPVRKINGVGEVTARKMTDYGIETIGQLQHMAEAELIGRFGKFGRQLAGFAQGRDDRKVSTGSPAKSVSAETTFAKDTDQAAQLLAAMKPLCERVAERLVRGRHAGGTVVLKLKTHDFKLLTRNRQLPNPTQQADVIFQQASDLVEREADGRFFRLIGVGVSDICPAAEADPPDLFTGL
ncbi:MAG: DNA polymerase IV [Rhodospirillaceae bacterium]|nr:DNA polymerase IV [Rhodospirillaceae bacterium]